MLLVPHLPGMARATLRQLAPCRTGQVAGRSSGTSLAPLLISKDCILLLRVYYVVMNPSSAHRVGSPKLTAAAVRTVDFSNAAGPTRKYIVGWICKSRPLCRRTHHLEMGSLRN